MTTLILEAVDIPNDIMAMADTHIPYTRAVLRSEEESKVERVYDIPRALEDLKGRLDDMGRCINELDSRLQVVSRDELPQVKDRVEKDLGGATYISRLIYEMVVEVEVYNSRLVNITDRLEI